MSSLGARPFAFKQRKPGLRARFPRGSRRSSRASRNRLDAACKIVRDQTTGELPAAEPEKMPRIFPFDINNLQGYAARLLSCAPLLSARCHLPMPGAVASSTEPLPRLRLRSVHTSGLKSQRICRKPAHDRFACTRKHQSRQWLAAFVADAFILPFSLRAAVRALLLCHSLTIVTWTSMSCEAASWFSWLPEWSVRGAGSVPKKVQPGCSVFARELPLCCLCFAAEVTIEGLTSSRSGGLQALFKSQASTRMGPKAVRRQMIWNTSV